MNVVFFSIYNFWGSTFILPQSILKEVDRKCRKYLRGTTTDKWKVSLVARDMMCRPKKEGGLNVKNCRFWNIASVGK